MKKLDKEKFLKNIKKYQGILKPGEGKKLLNNLYLLFHFKDDQQWLEKLEGIVYLDSETSSTSRLGVPSVFMS